MLHLKKRALVWEVDCIAGEHQDAGSRPVASAELGEVWKISLRSDLLATRAGALVQCLSSLPNQVLSYRSDL